jgi:hypothetical protein
MTYMPSWKSHRLTSHTWLGLNPQIGRPLSKIVVPLVYLFFIFITQQETPLRKSKICTVRFQSQCDSIAAELLRNGGPYMVDALHSVI